MPARYRQFWISKALRPRMRAWWGLVPRFRSGYDTDQGGELYCDIPAISPHVIPPAFRAVDLYLIDAALVESVLIFVRELGGRITDQNGDLA